MALHMRLMINDQQIGFLAAQRRTPGHPQDSDVCLYDWQLSIHGLTTANGSDCPLSHRYGDGAWQLVARVIAAATEPSAQPSRRDCAVNRADPDRCGLIHDWVDGLPTVWQCFPQNRPGGCPIDEGMPR